MNNPNEVRCERERLVIDNFMDSYCAGNPTCGVPHREWDAIKQKIESDAKRIAELEGCVAALRKFRNCFKRFYWSCNEIEDALHAADAALNRPGEASSASDTPMAGKENEN